MPGFRQPQQAASWVEQSSLPHILAATSRARPGGCRGLRSGAGQGAASGSELLRAYPSRSHGFAPTCAQRMVSRIQNRSRNSAEESAKFGYTRETIRHRNFFVHERAARHAGIVLCGSAGDERRAGKRSFHDVHQQSRGAALVNGFARPRFRTGSRFGRCIHDYRIGKPD